MRTELNLYKLPITYHHTTFIWQYLIFIIIIISSSSILSIRIRSSRM
jgi:hypothetical protein